MNINRIFFNFILIIPIINAIATNTTSYFTAGTLNPGTLRAFLIGAFAIYFILKQYPVNSINYFILFYLFFYLGLALSTSNVNSSLYIYFKFFIGTIMFPLGYYYVNNIKKLKMLTISFLIALVLFILNVVIANVFKLGTSDYLEDTMYFGAGRVNITKTMIALIFTAPLALLFIKNKFNYWVAIIIFIIGVVICFMGIKRSVLLTIPAGMLVYGFLKRNKLRLVKVLIVISLLFVLTPLAFPRYMDLFLQRLDAREERVEFSDETLETEGRYNEVSLVWQAWVNGDIKHKLVGSELFNDTYFFKTNRMLHTDYMIILNGSGIIGFLLWFYFIWRVIKEKNKYYKHISNIYLFQELNAVFYMMLAAQLLMSISGTVYSIDLRSVIFLFWGATIGVMRTEAMSVLKQSTT